MNQQTQHAPPSQSRFAGQGSEVHGVWLVSCTSNPATSGTGFRVNGAEGSSHEGIEGMVFFGEVCGMGSEIRKKGLP
jgi:hypothetical protein